MTIARTDQAYLTERQYKDGSNLDARIALHRRFSTATKSWHRWLFECMDLSDDARVLEVGCGTAAIWTANVDRIPRSWDITLTDLSPGMLEEARGNLARSVHNFSFHVSDCQRLPFPTDSFDAVIANHMLYHLPDIGSALTEIRRVLRAGGQLYASTMGCEFMPELDAALRAINPEVGFGQTLSFTLEDGAPQLREHFENVQVELFEDALEVTESEPLIAYVASTSSWEQLSEEERESFAMWVQIQLERDGSIHINKAQGVFAAW